MRQRVRACFSKVRDAVLTVCLLTGMGLED
jgi:hypothetical protein